MKDLVSIIVPVYNAQNYIEETVMSVINQTYSNWELLLVDDCSGDDSIQVMRTLQEKDSRIRLLLQWKNAGAAEARNKGLIESRGRYIAFLDADDLWKPEKIEHEVEFINKKKAAFAFTGYEFADENGIGKGKVVKVPETISYREALQNTTIFTSTVLFDTLKIPKDLLKMPKIKSEDTATWFKILRSGYTAYGLNENLVLYRRPAKSLSSNKVEALRRIWNLYREAEHLSLASSLFNFVLWAYHAIIRRV